MEAAVAQAMEEGAFGLSTSLIYVPDRFASTEEIVALAKVAAPLRRQLHHPPAREDDDDRRRASTRCSASRARPSIPAADLPPEDVAARPNWGRMPAVLKRIEAGAREGLDVSADQYP